MKHSPAQHSDDPLHPQLDDELPDGELDDDLDDEMPDGEPTEQSRELESAS